MTFPDNSQDGWLRLRVWFEHLHSRILQGDIQRIGERLKQLKYRLFGTGGTGRGKSAFLNLLLGGSCQLPTGATPITATVRST